MSLNGHITEPPCTDSAFGNQHTYPEEDGVLVIEGGGRKSGLTLRDTGTVNELEKLRAIYYAQDGLTRRHWSEHALRTDLVTWV